jgi:hypothetical protein
MKAVKGFVKTCYSEALIPTTSSVTDHEREDGSLITETKEGSPPPEAEFHGASARGSGFQVIRRSEISGSYVIHPEHIYIDCEKPRKSSSEPLTYGANVYSGLTDADKEAAKGEHR